VRFVDASRDRFGVEPICRVLQVAPSSYYAAKRRRPCQRRVRDEVLKVEIARVHAANYGVYGARMVWRQLGRDGVVVARCTVERLMREMGLAGRTRGAKRRTTIPADTAAAAHCDRVERRFVASAPIQLWIADITSVATWSGFAYTAFVTAVFSRRIVGWRVANTLRTDLALDALEMAIWSRTQNLEGLVHHSDRGVQYLSIRYTERLAAEGAVTSVGSRGDSYDNAMAESIIGLYKSELITMRGPWRIVDDVELATLSWVHRWNTTRLHSAIGHVPPDEFEAAHYAHLPPAHPAGFH
jgi:putative transposase